MALLLCLFCFKHIHFIIRHLLNFSQTNQPKQSVHVYIGCRVLELCDCKWVSAPSVAHLRGFSGLEYLNLSRCSGLTSLPEAISGLRSLQLLDLHSCYKLRCLPEVLSTLPSLRTLALGFCFDLERLPEGIGALTLLLVRDHKF